MHNRIKIIAEAGPNHNGKINLALKLVDLAKSCGADYVKFQTSIPKNHISKFATKANYQKINTKKNENQLKMAEKISLSFDDFLKIKKYCNKKKIGFLSTAFGLKSIRFLKKLKMDYFKIPSGEITNLHYLQDVAKTKKRIILSTGMSSILEIKNAMKILIKNGAKRKKITIMQCNTEYPTPLKDANIRAMLSIKKICSTRVGYSDHTEGSAASFAAAALGASIIEKHLTINKKFYGPDHKASLNGKEFKSLVQGIRKIEVALGDSVKKASNSERKNIKIARNSIVALKKIKKGEKFTVQNLIAKRPGNGISPMKFPKVYGKKAKRNFKEDELIVL